MRKVRIVVWEDLDDEQFGTVVSETGVRIAMGATQGPVLRGETEIGAFDTEETSQGG